VQVARRAFTELHVRIEDVLIDDDKVAARLRWSGIRDGRSVERETIDILRVEHGRVVEHWGARLWASERLGQS
jgi:predicted ester cyclase